MTKTQRILTALTQGNKTVEELADEIDVHPSEMRRVIGEMRRVGYIQSIPTCYTLTDKGATWQKRVIKTPKIVIERKVQQRREKRLENVSMVEQAKTTPNSVFALGGI